MSSDEGRKSSYEDLSPRQRGQVHRAHAPQEGPSGLCEPRFPLLHEGQNAHFLEPGAHAQGLAQTVR